MPRYRIARPPGGRRSKPGVAARITTPSDERRHAGCGDGPAHERRAYGAQAPHADRSRARPRARARARSRRPRASGARPRRSAWRRSSSAPTGWSPGSGSATARRARDPRYRFPNVLRIEPPFDDLHADDVTETAQARRHAQRRRPQPSDGDRDGAPHRRRDGAESWSGTFKTRAVAHPRRQAARHVRAQARDLDGDADLAAATPRIASPSSARAITSRWISLVPS